MLQTHPANPEPITRPIVLIGLMGVGKTTVGRRLAQRLKLPFVDADAEIEAAAGMTVAEIFERFGEPHFRDGERRVIARLIDGEPKVIATGGLAPLFAEGTTVIETTDQDTTLDGLRLLALRNPAPIFTRTARRDDP